MIERTGYCVKPRNPWAQAAHTADHQIDAHARLTGLVQGFDDLGIGQRVELGDDVRRLAFQCELGFPGNHVQHALFRVNGACSSFFIRRVLPMPISWLNSLPTSSVSASSDVSRL